MRQPSTPTAADVGRGVLLVHLVLSPLVFSRFTTEAFESNKVALLMLAALTLMGVGLWAGVSWALAAPPRDRRGAVRRFLGELARDPLALGFVLFAASAAVSTAASISPWTSLLGTHESYAGLGTILAYVVLFFATRALCRGPADAWRFLAPGVVASAVVAAYAVLQFAHLDPLPWDDLSTFAEHKRPFATLGHPNILAAYLVTTLAVVAAFAARAGVARAYGSLAALAGVAALALTAVLLTLSRGAWLALACGGALLLVLAWRAGRRRGAVLAAAALLGAAACAAVGLGAAGRSDLWHGAAERVRHLTDASTRREIWAAGLKVFLDRPLVGCGPDTFPLAFEAKRTAVYWRLEWNATPARAHNEIVHVLATQGSLGGVALLAVLGGLVVAGVRAWRATPESRGLVAAACAGALAFCVQNLFGFTLAPVGTFFVTLAGVLSALGLPRTTEPALARPRPSGALWAARAAVVALTGLLAVKGVAEPYAADLACRAGEVALAAGEPRLDDFLRAVELAPHQEFYRLKLSAAAQAAAREATSPEDGARLLRLARGAAEEALRLAPSALGHANLGGVLTDMVPPGLASADEALAEFDRAIAADPNNACFLADAGQSALRLGRPGRAHDYFARGIAVEPDGARPRAGLGIVALAQRQFGEAAALLERAEGAEWHGDHQAHLDACQSEALADLGAGRLRSAELVAAMVVSQRPARLEPRLTYARVLEVLGRTGEALAEYRQALAIAPDNVPARNGVRRLEAQTGAGARAAAAGPPPP
jgi:O-antigen ligase/tetratricopeptide (TPR) repeat protein